LGEVKNPGCFSYVPGMTASEAVAMAGGYTYRAKKNQLVITRNGNKLGGDHDTPVLWGDVIEVLERLF
jgi:polysaccharide export outer membrane protein